MSRVRRSFSTEFKLEAARQVTELGRPISHVARDLDLTPQQLRDWRKNLVAQGEVSAPVRVVTPAGKGRRSKPCRA